MCSSDLPPLRALMIRDTSPPSPPPPQSPNDPGYVHPSGELTPTWQLVHRGEVDLAAAWGDAGRHLALNTSTPKVGALVGGWVHVRVRL